VQHGGPLAVGHEDLGHVPGHGHQVGPEQGHRRGICVQPANKVGAGLAPGDLERGRRGIDAGDRQASLRYQAGQRASTTADIHDGRGAELGSHGQVGIKIAAVGIQGIVKLRKTGLAEQRIGHVTTLGPAPAPDR